MAATNANMIAAGHGAKAPESELLAVNVPGSHQAVPRGDVQSTPAYGGRLREFNSHPRTEADFERSIRARVRRATKRYPRGVEQTSDLSVDGAISPPVCAKSDARGQSAIADERLRRVVDAWPTLPEPIRSAIVGLVESQSERN
jgi:hypothetical protein